jgi:hypothetical protein
VKAEPMVMALSGIILAILLVALIVLIWSD